MSLREIFGKNLTRLSKARGSFNHVARQLGIERRQFRKYLAGDTLPRQPILVRMAQYFRVDEESLFRDEQESAGAAAKLGPDWQAVFDRVVADPPRLEPGFYHTWFWSPDHPESVVGALTAVRVDEGGVTFRRLTASAERRGSEFKYVRGDHHGVVSERMGWMFFQGSNRVEPREPTLLVLKWVASSRPILHGHGFVITLSGPTLVNVVMTLADRKLGLRAALRFARSYGLDDPELGGHIASLLKRPLRAS